MPGSALVCSRYTWLLALCDFSFMLLGYCKFTYGSYFHEHYIGRTMINDAWLNFSLMWSRCAVSAIVQFHLNLRARSGKYVQAAKEAAQQAAMAAETAKQASSDMLARQGTMSTLPGQVLSAAVPASTHLPRMHHTLGGTAPSGV